MSCMVGTRLHGADLMWARNCGGCKTGPSGTPNSRGPVSGDRGTAEKLPALPVHCWHVNPFLSRGTLRIRGAGCRVERVSSVVTGTSFGAGRGYEDGAGDDLAGGSMVDRRYLAEGKLGCRMQYRTPHIFERIPAGSFTPPMVRLRPSVLGRLPVLPV